jgi:hypothetical protein
VRHLAFDLSRKLTPVEFVRHLALGHLGFYG